jgi:hypothetical protein
MYDSVMALGALPEVRVGQRFPSRLALSRAGVHRATQPGICKASEPRVNPS